MTAATARDARLPLSLALTFAATSLPLAGLGIAAGIHLPAYFAASMGVELVAVGAAFGLVRLIDVPVEPVLGVVMDRSRTRWGRYRVWTIAGAPLVMLGLYMLLVAERGVGQAYLVAWLLVMYLGNSILQLSHAAWASTLAKTYDDRARLFGVMGAVGVTGAVSVLAIPIVMERMGYAESGGVRAMIWTLIVLAPAAAAIVVWRTPETITPERPGQRFRWRDYVELVTDPNMARIILADLALSFGPASMAALYIFFFRDFLRFTPGQANLLLAFYIISGVIGAPALAWLATRISKHRTVMLACAIYSLLIVSFAFLPKGNVIGALPTMFMTGFLAAGFNVLTRAMTADVADEMRLRQGKERSGLLYALTTLTTKFAQGASIFLIFSVLDWRGFDPELGQANTPEAMLALVLCAVAVPVVFVMLGAVALIGYRLDAERAGEVRRQLEERDALLNPAAALESPTGVEIPAREGSR